MAGVLKDDKDWTWVLERPCAECGFDATALTRDGIGPRLLQATGDLENALAGPSVAQRPSPDVWSVLEYGCHVRDACRVFAERLALMLTTDDPGFANWDQDQTAVQERYGEQNPVAVARELASAAAVLASAFDAVSGPQWLRTGSRSDGARFTVESLGRYLVHDPVHHVFDATGVRQGDA